MVIEDANAGILAKDEIAMGRAEALPRRREGTACPWTAPTPASGQACADRAADGREADGGALDACRLERRLTVETALVH